jgi:hypothetical protein
MGKFRALSREHRTGTLPQGCQIPSSDNAFAFLTCDKVIEIWKDGGRGRGLQKVAVLRESLARYCFNNKKHWSARFSAEGCLFGVYDLESDTVLIWEEDNNDTYNRN